MTKSKDESFPLLYPVIDYFNHRFGAKVVWNMEKGDFFLTLEEPVKSGEQIFNNYAPKGNEECAYDHPLMCDPADFSISAHGIRLLHP
jgi:hypothetical protein